MIRSTCRNSPHTQHSIPKFRSSQDHPTQAYGFAKRGAVGSKLVFAVLFAFWSTGLAAPSGLLGPPQLRSVSGTRGHLPLEFEVNGGQTDPLVKFLARGSGYDVFVTSRGAVLALRAPHSTDESALWMRTNGRSSRRDEMVSPNEIAVTECAKRRTIVRLDLVGANESPSLEGLQILPGKASYFIGNNPKNWHTNISTYMRVRARNIYPGVDLVYYGTQQQLEYDFTVAPGANPKAIAIDISGTGRLHVDRDGSVALRTSGGLIRLQKPQIYQQEGAQRKGVAGVYVLNQQHRLGFRLGTYDRSKPLIIDPVVAYSTYLGGTGTDEAWSIAADAAGNSYVAGLTTSVDFPVSNALQSVSGGGIDAFITKFTSAGSALLYSTYIGGSGTDLGLGIAVDSSGNAYLTGSTNSANFPSFTPLHPTPSGTDAFVVKLNAMGSALLYSTVFGGSGFDRAVAIAIDNVGNAYVTGRTNSASDFPLVNPFQSSFGGGTVDAFVAKLNSAGTALLYSTYLGGSKDDRGFSIAVDSAGSAYVTGRTASSDFPTANAMQPVFGGGVVSPIGIPPIDGFVTKLSPSGSNLVYSTYIGGSGNDVGASIAVDGNGNAYITGATSSSDFPTANALQPSFHGGSGVFTGLPLDAWVAKLNANGSAFVYSTYLGGSGDDLGNGIAVGVDGSVFVAGETTSSDFTTSNALQPAFAGGGEDAFVVKLNPAGSAFIYSTYRGSSGDALDEFAQAIATDAAGNAYVAGTTNSANFPMVNPLQRSSAGGEDAWVAKIGPSVVPFLALKAKSDISLATNAFDLNAQFSLGSTSNGIAPVTEAVSFQIGTFSVTLPAGSFQQSAKGRFTFQGTVNGVSLQVAISPIGVNQFMFQAAGSNANLTGSANPVPVGITIGDDDGARSIMANFQ